MADEVETPDSGGEGEAQPQAGGDKMVPLSEVAKIRARARAAESRLAELENAESERKRASMSEIEKFQAENTDLKARVQNYEVRTRKADALRAAKAKIGDGWTLDGVEDQVATAVDRLSFDESTIDKDVAELVALAKRPRSGKSPVTGPMPRGAGGEPKAASALNGRELAQLQRDDPDAFAEAVEARRAAASFPTRPALGTPMMMRPPGGSNGSAKSKK